ncbi:hypothetical protein [Streptomyces cucumeris]|uniref:hypothetical protein n=1 Tax=Streptomyces cucumeris TaxID=2962890 RepID=UPI003D73514C
MKRRNTFSDGGFWRPAARTGRGDNLRELRDQATYDHQPRKRGLIARLTNPRGNR